MRGWARIDEIQATRVRAATRSTKVERLLLEVSERIASSRELRAQSRALISKVRMLDPDPKTSKR